MLIFGLLFGVLIASIWLIFSVIRLDLLASAQREWRKQGVIQGGPVAAKCYGSRPHRAYHNPFGRVGALGIVDDEVVFFTRRFERCSLSFASIRWAGLYEIEIDYGNQSRQICTLMLHVDGQTGWEVWVFQVMQGLTEQFAGWFAHVGGIQVHPMSKIVHSFGPFTAQRLTQDIYGQWSEDGGKNDLFLAPAHLIYGQSIIPLERITRVGILEETTLLDKLNPFDRDLLRIELGSDKGPPLTFGFLVREAYNYAHYIRYANGDVETIDIQRKKNSK